MEALLHSRVQASVHQDLMAGGDSRVVLISCLPAWRTAVRQMVQLTFFQAESDFCIAACSRILGTTRDSRGADRCSLELVYGKSVLSI